jgi:DNA end-binding protein Ku
VAEEDEGGGAGIRPFWSGSITFGLVSVPVALYAANRPRTVSMRMVGPDEAPVRRQYVCSKDGKPLDNDEIVRGYEIEKDTFVVVTDEELEAIEPRKSREIDLQIFVDAGDIKPIYFERAYFLTPAGGSNKAYRLLATVMEKKGRAGIATFVMRTKEYLVAILAENGVLRAETLRFHDEIRTPESIGLPEQKKVKAPLVRKFEQAIARKKGKADFSEFLDDYAERVEKVAEKKAKKGEGVVNAPEPVDAGEGEGGEVVDLLEALRRSLGQQGQKPARKSAGKGGTLEKRTKAELMKQAQKMDIAGRSSMSKEELISAIRKG